MDYNVYNNNVLVNIITADEQFIKQYCEVNGYTYEEIEREPTPETPATPSEFEQLRADIDYIAMEMGVEL